MKNTNNIYKYTRIETPGEENVRLEIVEDNGDRVMVRAINLGFDKWTIWPIENIARHEIMEAE